MSSISVLGSISDNKPAVSPKIQEFFDDFKVHKNMVLSNISSNRVHSRMMSIICIDKNFYFQTDKRFAKCEELKFNPNVSLCIDNISIEGTCKMIGKPSDKKEFLELYKINFPKAYELYSDLNSEVLYEVTPVTVKKFIYENELPFIETLNIISGEYIKQKCEIL